MNVNNITRKKQSSTATSRSKFPGVAPLSNVSDHNLTTRSYDLRKHYDRIKTNMIPKVNLFKYYVEHPNSYIKTSLLWFNIKNRFFSIRTGRGANYGRDNRYFNIHQDINVLGFDLSFKYKHDTERTFDIWHTY